MIWSLTLFSDGDAEALREEARSAGWIWAAGHEGPTGSPGAGRGLEHPWRCPLPPRHVLCRAGHPTSPSRGQAGRAGLEAQRSPSGSRPWSLLCRSLCPLRQTTQHPLPATVLCSRETKTPPFFPGPVVRSSAAREARAHLLLWEGSSGWSLDPADGASGRCGEGLGLEGRSPGFWAGLYTGSLSRGLGIAPPPPAAGTWWVPASCRAPALGVAPWWGGGGGQVVNRMTDDKAKSARCW